MKISELKVGQYANFDRLQILSLGNGEVVMTMEGQPVKRGKYPADITVTESTEKNFTDALSKANHNKDWYSMMLAECYADGYISPEDRQALSDQASIED